MEWQSDRKAVGSRSTDRHRLPDDGWDDGMAKEDRPAQAMESVGWTTITVLIAPSVR